MQSKCNPALRPRRQKVFVGKIAENPLNSLALLSFPLSNKRVEKREARFLVKLGAVASEITCLLNKTDVFG